MDLQVGCLESVCESCLAMRFRIPMIYVETGILGRDMIKMTRWTGKTKEKVIWVR